MKKELLTVLIVTIGFLGFSQNKIDSPKRLKYITTAPDGSIAMTVYDNKRDDIIKLESANNFYKYEILDLMTSEPVFFSKNNGKECSIDKSKIAPGTYNLRLYTINFIITSKIIIGTEGRGDSSLRLVDDGVASR